MDIIVRKMIKIKANHTGKLLEDRTKGIISKEATEDTLAAIRNNKNVITGEEGKKLAESIPMDRREYYTLEYFGTGGVASKKIASGGRVSLTESYYTSFDTENDRATKYTATTVSVGAGDDNLSVAAGFGFYFSDSPEEIQKLSTSAGGSAIILGWSIGIDFLSEATPGKNFVESFLKGIQGVRIYVGKSGHSKRIVPANVEKHATIMDIGNINIIKDKTILDYWEDESIPSGARLYYKYYYKKEDKNGQHKNEKK